MSEAPQVPDADGKSSPVSAYRHPLDGLVRAGVLDPPLHPGVVGTLESYEILQLIGAGGMGLVVLARDSRRGAKVAIKMLKPELAVNPEARHRFLVEARHVSSLDHPHILKVLEVGNCASSPYFVMPYCERGSLAGVLRSGPVLDREQIHLWARQIASALVYSHSKGIIHHDLKPGNILINDLGNACLTDFGLARTMFNDSHIKVNSTQVEGTAPYMSPVLAAGGAEDTRSDIYAFGAMLYEMLAGRAPYLGRSTQEILQQILQGPPVPITDLNDQAAPDLVSISDACMARELRNRYAQMADVLSDLEQAAEGKAIAGPHGQGRRHARPTFRIVTVAPLIMALVAPLVMTGLVYWRNQETHSRLTVIETNQTPPVRLIETNQTPMLRVIETNQTPLVSDWSQAQLGDWDGDQKPDVIVATSGGWLVRLHTGQILGPYAYAWPSVETPWLRRVVDINQDGLDDAVFCWSQGSNAFLSMVNQSQYELQRFHVAGAEHWSPTNGYTHTSLDLAGFVDGDNPQVSGLLVFGKTPWALNPRGLYMFEAGHQEPLWQYLIAPYPTAAVSIDLQNPGVCEIVMGSAATSNGNINNTPTMVMEVPGFIDMRLGYVMHHGLAPNGGGVRVNQYTLIMDLMVDPVGPVAASLIHIRDTNNMSDGDLFWQDNNFGQGNYGYIGTGQFTPGEWHRICAAYDEAADPPVVTKFLDGIKQDDWTANQGLDHPRRALLPTALLFADGDEDERRRMWVSSIQIRAGKLSDAEMMALGGPSANKIPQVIPGFTANPPRLSYTTTAGGFTVVRPDDAAGYLLEMKSDLEASSWVQVSMGTNHSIGIPTTNHQQYFRLRSPW